MLLYFSITLIVWLSVGFLVGLKAIYFDGMFNDEYFNKIRKNNSIDIDNEGFNLLIKSKHTFLAISTLTGLVSLFADIHGTIRSIKKNNKD